MKKFISIVLSIIVVASVFASCSNKKDDNTTKQNSTTVSEKSNSNSNQTTQASTTKKGLFKKSKTTTIQTTTAITTKSATIKDVDAINLISSYTDEELGLDADTRKNCSFMVAGSGFKIDNDYYVMVAATVKKEQVDPNTKEIVYTFDNKGEYYIRYDGKEILNKNLKNNHYTKMKVKQVTTSK